MKNEYDIIVCGGGMSGLSLIYRALKANIWSNKSIILIDKEIKTANDKTWCFWENTISPFEDVIFKKWKEMCIKIGAKPERCYKEENVIQPFGKYTVYCKNCGIKRQAYRKKKRIWLKSKKWRNEKKNRARKK